MRRHRNRIDAGRELARHLEKYARRTDVIVLALPRGGVPVAAEIATRLDAPLDVVLVRKIGVPGHPELAMGAIAEGGIKLLSHRLIRDLAIPARLVVAAPDSFSAVGFWCDDFDPTTDDEILRLLGAAKPAAARVDTARVAEAYPTGL